MPESSKKNARFTCPDSFCALSQNYEKHCTLSCSGGEKKVTTSSSSKMSPLAIAYDGVSGCASDWRRKIPASSGNVLGL